MKAFSAKRRSGFRIPRLLAATTLAAGISALLSIGALAAGEPAGNQAGGTAAAPAPRIAREITQETTARHRADAQRARQLEQRERAAQAIEARIARRGQTPAASQDGATGGDTAAASANPADERLNQLARIYQAMKPARAAALLEQLDPALQLAIMQRLRERTSAQLLSLMNPAKAAALSTALARNSAGNGAITRP